MNLNPDIWGPHYWFVLYTIAISYPINPNDVTKKKYYDFIQNLPLFIPIPNIGNNFSQFIDKYPVTPYLDSRESFTKWVHFIHNKINIYLGKSELSYYESMNKYYENYKLKTLKKKEEKRKKFKYIFASLIIILLIIVIIFNYNK
jgi:hypothetical protein|tara:strand:+ start:3954 stop:4388 length:435 start_codon:yes stop_codon:yes gene_type:complete